MRKKINIDKYLKKPKDHANYGTAGYRSNTEDLINIICRASFIAFIRSSSFAGKRIGLMITASHNPADYNGVKFIDHNGHMLDSSWEKCSDDLVNCEDKDFSSVINKIFRKHSNLGDFEDGVGARVVLGRDTRESGIEIVQQITNALSQVNCFVEDYGEVTTPEMHYLVKNSNINNKLIDKDSYLTNLAEKFKTLSALTKNNTRFYVDTANGIVGKKLVELGNIIGDDFGIEILNSDNGVLNENCGADFVKTKSRVPLLEKITDEIIGRKNIFASFDGDADRLMCFTIKDKFDMIDGDAQAVFLAFYFQMLLFKMDCKLKIGIVLSHYSNGAAIDNLKQSFSIELLTAGVKNFVKAARKYDVGIYFEPNGHGSVIFSDEAKAEANNGTSLSHQIFKVLTEMFDPCIGDALANFLIYKCIFTSIDHIKLYKENSSRLLTVKIKNKNVLKVNETNEVIYPTGIQDKINSEIQNIGGRAFVRPSGTEDLVRVFAECTKEIDADMLALNVAQIVYDFCEGVGAHPEIDYTK